MSKKIVILGNGYVGKNLYDRLLFPGPGKKSYDVKIEKRKLLNYNDVKSLEAYLDREKPDYVINCSGFTGRPNVDEGELKQELCFELNTFGPLRVSNLCKIKNINYIHISSGCIYTGYDKPWEEDDEPNFGLFDEDSSTYSKSKHAFELGCDWGLILRVRMPFCDILHDRSFITKIYKYDNLIDRVNSKTYIPQLLDFIEHFVSNDYEAKEKDILNFVNPEALSTARVTQMMEKFDVVNPDWDWVHYCDLDTVAHRSNCVMSTDKLEEEYGFKMWEEEVALECALTNIINI
jgi:dTDP-4-dehydrorhamnose reductase